MEVAGDAWQRSEVALVRFHSRTVRRDADVRKADLDMPLVNCSRLEWRT